MGLKTGPRKGLKTRPNGTPPPEIPLADVHLDSLDFWSRNDDVRDASFAALHRDAPISFPHDLRPIDAGAAARAEALGLG